MDATRSACTQRAQHLRFLGLHRRHRRGRHRYTLRERALRRVAHNSARGRRLPGSTAWRHVAVYKPVRCIPLYPVRLSGCAVHTSRRVASSQPHHLVATPPVHRATSCLARLRRARATSEALSQPGSSRCGHAAYITYASPQCNPTCARNPIQPQTQPGSSQRGRAAYTSRRIYLVASPAVRAIPRTLSQPGSSRAGARPTLQTRHHVVTHHLIAAPPVRAIPRPLSQPGSSGGG